MPRRGTVRRAQGPNGAKVLVFFVINIEEWGIERPMPRQVLTAPTNLPVVPDLANWAWHEYGMRVGFWRMLKACEARGIKPTLSINGNVCNAYPAVAQAAHEAGWEFMGHGFKQIPTHQIDDQRAMVRETVETIARFTGAPPVGWLGPGLTQTLETTDILAEHGIRYCADYVVDDVPVPVRTSHGPIWSMPYSVELNDIPMIMVQHHRAAELQERTTPSSTGCWRRVRPRAARSWAWRCTPISPACRIASACWKPPSMPLPAGPGQCSLRAGIFWNGGKPHEPRLGKLDATRARRCV
jgi:allantoinase